MIYAITLNPAIDHIIETNGFNKGETNYYNNDYAVVGGKGINVSIILNNLGSDVLSIGLMGNNNKEIFINKFKEQKLDNKFFFFNGFTRTNFKIKNLDIKEETELNGLGTEFDLSIFDELISYLSKNIKNGDVVIASGSLPKGIGTDAYLRIGEVANKNKATFILDTSKKQMIEGLKSKPFLIKPNLEEICEILGKDYKEYNFDEVKSMIEELRKLGARNVLVSMGSKGAYYFEESNNIYTIGIAKGKLVNSVGSGDSMIGGFAYGISKGLDIKEVLKYGSAAGGATAFTQWLGTKSEIENLLSQISVEKI